MNLKAVAGAGAVLGGLLFGSDRMHEDGIRWGNFGTDFFQEVKSGDIETGYFGKHPFFLQHSELGTWGYIDGQPFMQMGTEDDD